VFAAVFSHAVVKGGGNSCVRSKEGGKVSSGCAAKGGKRYGGEGLKKPETGNFGEKGKDSRERKPVSAGGRASQERRQRGGERKTVVRVACFTRNAKGKKGKDKGTAREQLIFGGEGSLKIH